MTILKSSKTIMFGYKVAENLCRLFGLTLDEFRKFEADQGDDIDEEFASIFEKLGPLRLREAMNWKIIALATIYEERKTGKRMTLDEIGAFAWTLGLKMVVLEEGELKVAENV